MKFEYAKARGAFGGPWLFCVFVRTVYKPLFLCSSSHCLPESISYRLPILGPRTAVFHRLLSSAYENPRDTQHRAFPRKKGMSKTVKQ